jgi:hypothetical protein
MNLTAYHGKNRLTASIEKLRLKRSLNMALEFFEE